MYMDVSSLAVAMYTIEVQWKYLETQLIYVDVRHGNTMEVCPIIQLDLQIKMP